MRGQIFSRTLCRIGTCAGCALVSATFAFGFPTTQPTTQPLIHVPDEPSQARAERMVREVFAKDYAGHTPAQRVALAQKMLQQAGDTTDDPAARFVLLREARDLAASAGDPGTTQRA